MKKLFIIGLLSPLGLLAQSKKAVTKSKFVSPKSIAASSVDRGKLLFTTYCLTCHQADGSGVPNLNPPLIKTIWVLGNKTTLIQQLLKGSQGKVEIDGETFHNVMPSMAHLNDQQIADVLSYVRNSFGNKASFVAPAEVKLVRAKTK
jgi:mono/diheme cytochrome c family protein